MKLQPLVIYGAGGFAREVMQLVRDINACRPTWEIVGFLDDRPERRGEVVHNIPVLGGGGWLDAYPGMHVAMGIGSPKAKLALTSSIRSAAPVFPQLVHPSVVLSDSIHFAEGVIVTAGCILTVDIQLGAFCAINLSCTVGHDAAIGPYSTVAPGCTISGNVHLGEGCDLGTGCSTVQEVQVGEWSVVGAGAVVAKSLPPNCTAVGVPAKVIKEREVGWQLIPG